MAKKIFMIFLSILTISVWSYPSFSQSDKWKQFEKIEQAQDCFKVYKILPSIYAIQEVSKVEVINSYLITGTEKTLLFDSGLGTGNIKKVVKHITDKDIILLNSHTHYDHIGGNYLFEVIYGMETEFTKNNARGKTNDELNKFYKTAYKTDRDLPVKDFHIKPFKISHYIKDGDKIDLGDRVVEVIVAPGHSKDDICLLDRKNRLLFTGDVFYEGTLFAGLPESDINLYYKSAARLKIFEEHVDHLLPAHSVPLCSSKYLSELYNGFRAILEGKIKYTRRDEKRNFRLYRFEGFSIMTPDAIK